MSESKGFSGRNPEIPKHRIFFAGIIFGSVILIYGFYLYSLQIVHGGEYQAKATEVARREQVIPAQRGEIYDRNFDVPLVMNIPSFAVDIVPAEVDDENREYLYERLAEVLEIDAASVRKKIPPAYYHLFEPIEIKDSIDYETITYLAEHLDEFPGVSWHNKPIRSYLETGSISHILGYVGNITVEDLQILYNQGYQRNATIGKAGIEKQYDSLLRGESGKSFHTVDVKGRSIGTDDLDDIPPKNGMKLVLTIDRRIQTLCENALGERMGSVVVLKPNTGEVLAMVSYPFYDPNEFYTDRRAEIFNELSLDTRFPFLNRAIQSSYAPASTFKIIMTTAVLEEEVFSLDKTINCEGEMWYGDRTFHCHKRSGHGELNLASALAESCNVFFYTMGAEYLGIERIADYSRRFGFGDLTGIDLPGEIDGIVASPLWKESNFNSRWVGGDTLNTSIGQGYMSVTPLQVANMIAMIVNEGRIYRPYILKEVREPVTGAVIEKIEPQIIHESTIRRETFENVQDFMRGVITDGTARWVISTQATEVAGKTGTGEVGLEEQWSSWFAAYAPYSSEDPDDQVVVVVKVDGSNVWEWWAPKAADMIFQGIFADQTYDEVFDEFQNRWYIKELIERRNQE
ncbi:MAG: penicillin-binding protein 2 [Spirochaetales bacterium]|nr:penicillin-binding protein 2 [Spirochaetales bacterium]